MARIPVAIDNSVLGDLTDPNLPVNKREDLRAFKQIIQMDHDGIFEIGIPISTTMIEAQHAGGDKTKLAKQKMGDAWRLWPVAVLPETSRRMCLQAQCLQEIMQDKDGIDSKNLITSTIYTRYYLTTDYRYIRRFRSQATRITKLCGINVRVLSPSEFLKSYNNGELS